MIALALGACVGSFGRERLLPRPAPLAIHGASDLDEDEQQRLADIRRFLSPSEQELLEETLKNLAADPRLPEHAGESALKRALSGVMTPSGFCSRLADELRPLALTGPRAAAPETIAFAVPIEYAHAHWLSSAGRSRYRDSRDLARAVRDGEVAAGSFDTSAYLGQNDGPLFVTDAAEFDRSGPSAARRLCLWGPPSSSYVIAIVPTAKLETPLRVPTAADAVCRPHFTLAPPDADRGVTCSGRPEFVTRNERLEVVAEFRLTR